MAPAHQAFLLCLGVMVSLAVAGPTKVLPLGDSITFGCGDGCTGLGCEDQCAVLRPTCQSGYRSGLWNKLSPGLGNSTEWAFVGTQENGPDGIDKHHAGYPGWTIEEVAKISDQWLPLNPDIILLHLGTNNMGVVGLQQAPAALGHMSDMLDLIFASLPKVELYLSTLIGSAEFYGGEQHADFNEGLKMFVGDFKAKGFNIKIVDMAAESGIGDECDSVDCCPGGVHPNMVGYNKMADVWYKHIKAGRKDEIVV